MPEYSPGFYRGAARLVVPLARYYFRLEAVHPERVPASGAVVLAANHTSYIDPILLGTASPRPIRFMMLKSYWDRPLIGFLSSFLGAFPVENEGISKSTLRWAESILGNGEALGIFPEGGRGHTGELQPGKAGAVLLAMRQRAPIVPVGIKGAFEAYPRGAIIPRRRKVSVRFGKIFDAHLDYEYPRGKTELSPLTLKLMERIKKLLEEPAGP